MRNIFYFFIQILRVNSYNIGYGLRVISNEWQTEMLNTRKKEKLVSTSLKDTNAVGPAEVSWEMFFVSEFEERCINILIVRTIIIMWDTPWTNEQYVWKKIINVLKYCVTTVTERLVERWNWSTNNALLVYTTQYKYMNT